MLALCEVRVPETVIIAYLVRTLSLEGVVAAYNSGVSEGRVVAVFRALSDVWSNCTVIGRRSSGVHGSGRPRQARCAVGSTQYPVTCHRGKVGHQLLRIQHYTR